MNIIQNIIDKVVWRKLMPFYHWYYILLDLIIIE
jgi:hypothetical protein